MRALIVKEFRELMRDRRTLAMLVGLPIVLLVIFGYAANFSVDRVSVAVLGEGASALADDLDAIDAAVENLDIDTVDATLSRADGERMLREQRVEAVIVAQPADDGDPIGDRMQVLVDGSALFPAQAAEAAFVQIAAEDAASRMAAAAAALAQAAAMGQQPDGITLTAPDLDADELVTVLFNPDLQTSWVMVPGLIGLILTFIGTLVTSIGLVRERETGTLEQLAVMPLRPGAIILGKIVPYFLLALVDMAAIVALGVWLFGVPFVGSFWLFAAAAVVFCFVVLGVGVLVSTVSQSTGQAIQLAILFVVPQVMLSGLIFPLESMPPVIRWIGYVLPLTWFRDIAQGIMLRGADLDSLWVPLVVLGAMAVVIFGAATVRMRRSLTRGGAR